MFQAIDRALENNGLKIMILLRLSPLIPYTALDYLSGLTSISFWVYMLALVAILPGTIVFCFMGASASSITSGGDDGTTKTVSLVLGVMFALVGVLVASYYSKMELDKVRQVDGYRCHRMRNFAVSNSMHCVTIRSLPTRLNLIQRC